MYRYVIDNKTIEITGIIIEGTKWELRDMNAFSIEDRIAELPIDNGFIDMRAIYDTAVEECKDDTDVYYTGMEYIDGAVGTRLVRISLYDDDMDYFRRYTFTLSREVI